MPASPEVLLSLSPAVLRALLSAFASTISPAAKKPPLAPPALVRDLFTHGASKKLLSVLSTRVSRFSPRPGRLALVEAARASSDPRAEPWLAEPCADVAALLAIQLENETKAPKRRALRRLFALAAHRVERDLPERPTYELVAESSSSSALAAPATLKLLERALGPRLVDAWSATDPDGTQRFALFLKQPTENRLVYDEDAQRVVQRRDVPIAVDLVRVSPSPTASADSRARVAITTAMPELLPVYSSALSLSLAPSFTLRPLSELTHEELARVARATRGVSRIDVIAIRYRRPDGERVEVRAPDALASWHAGPRTGYIDRVTLRFVLEGGAGAVDAFLHLPHRVEISDRAFEAPVRAALSALGLFAPGALPDDARSLAPYEHGEWRWRAVLGDALFERLRKTGRLVRTQSAHVSTHEHRMHGAAYVVRDVDGERDVQYALAEDRSLGARLVGPKDRVAWRLDTRALAAAMTKDLGARAAPQPLAIAGVLDLGVVTLASGKLRVVYAMAEPAAGWVETVRRASGVGVTPVVLVPRGHAGDARGMLEIEIDVAEQLGGRSVGRVLGRIAEALGIEKEVDPWRVSDADVLVDSRTDRVWVKGVSIRFNEHRWRFVSLLARKGGAVAATKDIGAAISKSSYPDVVARRMKRQVDRQVRRELEAQGEDASIVDRMIVVDGRLGYRFGVSVRVV
ncbi:MAG: hypothetical protein ACLQVI_10620 [Polyangiaceae bacterium]